MEGLLPKMCGSELLVLPHTLTGFSALLIGEAFPEDLDRVDYREWMYLPEVSWNPGQDIDGVDRRHLPVVAVIEHSQIPWSKMSMLRDGVRNGLSRAIMPWVFLTVWLSDADLPLSEERKTLLAMWLADGSGREKLQKLNEHFRPPCAGYWYTDDDPTVQQVEVFCSYQ